MSAGSLPLVHPIGTRHDHYVLRLLDKLKRDSARTVVHWRGGAITAGDLHCSILDSVYALGRAGVDATSTVAILTEPNLPAMLSVRYGAHLLGATVTHVRSMNARTDNEHLPLAAQTRILRETGARVLVVDETNAARGRALSGGVAGLVVLHLDDLKRDTPQVPEFAPYVPGNIAVVDLTSGTTNSPKMVRQPFGVREARIRLSAGESEPGYYVTLLSVTPISHATATMVDAVLVGGGAVVLHPEFDADDVLRAIVERGVTDVYLPVPHLYALLDHPGIAGADLSSLRQVLYSGTAAAPVRIMQAVAVFGVALAQLYGSTEASGMCTLTPLDHREPELLGTVGRPFSWVELEIRHAESDIEVERGEIGEICVRSPTVMAGYLGEQSSAVQLSRDGWLRTGDRGYWDRYGYLHLVGRIGNIIKTNGLKLDPAAIEAALLTHAGVANAVVYGVRDADYSEHAHAAVQLRGGVQCTVDDLRTHLATALSPAHVPAGITFWDEIPLNGSGKPDYVGLRTGQNSL